MTAHPTKGLCFRHSRVLDANNKPMAYVVTKVAKGVVYYKPLDGGRSEYTGVAEFGKIVKDII